MYQVNMTINIEFLLLFEGLHDAKTNYYLAENSRLSSSDEFARDSNVASCASRRDIFGRWKHQERSIF